MRGEEGDQTQKPGRNVVEGPNRAYGDDDHRDKGDKKQGEGPDDRHQVLKRQHGYGTERQTADQIKLSINALPGGHQPREAGDPADEHGPWHAPT